VYFGTAIAIKGSVRSALCAATLLLISVTGARAYSVLTHEAIIDSAWERIRPLLVARFPNTSPDELRKAHGYAYAGCIIQDMGYYPRGSKFFSDLLHYVRTGDFIKNMIRESRDVDEYAFALGSLAHYASDTQGHSIAVNRSVPIQYPKLRRRYGDVVTYEENQTAHIRVEFQFDVVQVAHGNYAPQAYRDFIGFEVAEGVLARAFRDTYGLEMTDLFADLDRSLETYRHTVSSIIPKATRVAWNIHKDELQKAQPGLTRNRFVYNLSRASYRKNWSNNYDEPGIGTRLLALIIRILPKVGPFSALAFRPPMPQTEQLFEKSFDATLAAYRSFLQAVPAGTLQLPDRDLDTGEPTRPGEYRMADDTYALLAINLAQKDPASIDPALRNNVLAFFSDLDQPFATKRDKKQWQKAVAAVGKLKQPQATASRVQQ
jgi:hypothetical protein